MKTAMLTVRRQTSQPVINKVSKSFI